MSAYRGLTIHLAFYLRGTAMTDDSRVKLLFRMIETDRRVRTYNEVIALGLGKRGAHVVTAVLSMDIGIFLYVWSFSLNGAREGAVRRCLDGATQSSGI